jgi:hypothetical protein
MISHKNSRNLIDELLSIDTPINEWLCVGNVDDKELGAKSKYDDLYGYHIVKVKQIYSEE